MIRTQVYLPQYQIDHLKLLAGKNKTTMSDELRKRLDLTLNIRKVSKTLSEILANADTSWFTEQNEKDLAENRKQISQRLKKWAY